MDRCALVTGGSSGIGLAIARMLAEEGYSVTISARRLDALKRAVEMIGDRAYPVTADVKQEDHVLALLRAHTERFGRLDVLVNSAGVAGEESSASADAARVDHQIAVNLRGPLLVTRAALPLLRAAGAQHGKALIVNLSSVAGKQGQPGNASYSATKAGLISLTESVQREFAHEGIQATALCPGLVSTPMTQESPIAQDQMLRPEDVAEAVRFLLRTSPWCLVPEIVLNRRGAIR